jgi:hypothetical protein
MHLARAEGRARAGGSRTLQALVLETRAAVADGAEATEHLRAAQSLYVEAGATDHADRLARELAS